MRDLLDLDRFPIERPDSPQCLELIQRCKAELSTRGMFTLEGFVNAPALERAVSELDPLLDTGSYRHTRTHNPGAALNWHFDRSQFTTTLLIRAAASGGEFQYRSGLRSETDPNFDGVARLLRGEDPQMSVLPLAAGSLNVFAGRHTAQRVSPVGGASSRIVAVFSYHEEPGFTFSDAERLGFYGRSHQLLRERH